MEHFMPIHSGIRKGESYGNEKKEKIRNRTETAGLCNGCSSLRGNAACIACGGRE
jgi:hypothetical protein